MNNLPAAIPFLTAAVLATSLAAQTGSVVVSTDYNPRSVHVHGTQVICCMTESGRQITVDATIPTSPSVSGLYNPTFGDQFGDGVYTRAFGGRLIAGYRWGGITYNDVSAAPVITTPDTDTSVGTLGQILLLHTVGSQNTAATLRVYGFNPETDCMHTPHRR